MKVPTVIKNSKTTKIIRLVDYDQERQRKWKAIRRLERKKKIIDAIAIVSILVVPSIFVVIVYLIWG